MFAICTTISDGQLLQLVAWHVTRPWREGNIAHKLVKRMRTLISHEATAPTLCRAIIEDLLLMPHVCWRSAPRRREGGGELPPCPPDQEPAEDIRNAEAASHPARTCAHHQGAFSTLGFPFNLICKVAKAITGAKLYHKGVSMLGRQSPPDSFCVAFICLDCHRC